MLQILVGRMCCCFTQSCDRLSRWLTAALVVAAASCGGIVGRIDNSAPPQTQDTVPAGTDDAIAVVSATPAEICAAAPTILACQLNGTNSPIGGGVGYSRIVTRAQVELSPSNHIVSTKEQLQRALSQATAGDIVFVPGDAIIDLTGTQLTIPGGVTLASNRGLGENRGALLVSRSEYPWKPGQLGDEMLRTGGPDVRITGLRLKGPPWGVAGASQDHAAAIRGLHGFLEIDNCELSDWHTWAIDLAIAWGDRIHHNHIHHARQDGYGYGVWVRGPVLGAAICPECTWYPAGATSAAPRPRANCELGAANPSLCRIPKLVANLLENCRHELAAGDKGSYIARNNIVLEHHAWNHQFDQHGAGDYLEIYRNMFAMRAGHALGGMSKIPRDEILFKENWVAHRSLFGTIRNYHLNLDPSAKMSTPDNKFDVSWATSLPKVALEASVVRGPSPLSVDFTATATATDGVPVDAYLWRFLGGRKTHWTSKPTFSKTYEKLGLYKMTVYARNALGLLSEPVDVAIEVTNAPSQISGGLAAYWDFSGSEPINDSYFGLEMQPTGDVRQTDGGVRQQAAGFSGSAGLKLSPYRTEPVQIGSNDMTISLWLKADPTTQPQGRSGVLSLAPGDILRQAPKVVYRGYALTITGGTSLQFWLSDGLDPAKPGGPTRPIMVANNVLSPNEWNHIIIELNKTQAEPSIELFVSGARSTATPLTFRRPHIFNPRDNFQIAPALTSRFKGQLDEIGIWQRALSANERQWLYNDGLGQDLDGIRAHQAL